jgi:hypothetical protein
MINYSVPNSDLNNSGEQPSQNKEEWLNNIFGIDYYRQQ